MSTELRNAGEAVAEVQRLLGGTPGGRFLSNGRYTVLVTREGCGRSAVPGCALTRWSGDRLEDASGYVVWLRDADSGRLLALGGGSGDGRGGRARAAWRPGRFTLQRDDDGLSLRMDVCVAPGADAELRRVTVVNRGGAARTLDVTTCAEIVLNAPEADAGHPAFSKLFVQTEYAAEANALLARRRPRANDERHPWLVHALLEGGLAGYETDRMRFFGRVGAGAVPAAVASAAPLPGSVGSVLDPVAALRRRLVLAPGERAELTFLLGLADDRAAALELATRWAGTRRATGVFARAASAERERLRSLALDARAAESLHSLAAAVVYGYPGLRADAATIAAAAPAPGLAARLGAAACRPFALAVLDGFEDAARLGELSQAARYWKALGTGVGLVVLHDGTCAIPDGVTALREDSLTAAERTWLAAAAHAVLVAGPVATGEAVLAAERIAVTRRAAANAPAEIVAPAVRDEEPLREFNGYGGFSADGREYVVRMKWEGALGHRRPPLPWTNVIANEHFGFLVSESGAGCTWSVNSREHRLTPWSNDPVLDPHGEALWLRDEESGAFWSPTPGPTPAAADYEARHGFGSTTFRHESGGLAQEVCTFAATDSGVRLTRVAVTNRSGRPRRISLYAYARLVLGVLPEESGRFVVTEHEPAARALLARNAMAGEFAGRVAFAACIEAPEGASRQVTCDRGSFLGTGGTAAPEVVARGSALDGRAGAGLDACFAERITLELAPGERAHVAFALGECATAAEATALLRRLRTNGAVAGALEEARSFWEALVSGVHVETPRPELDLMVNGWLAYQTLSCRIWGRTAFYQSGGAYGFRDQLQDATSLVALRPELARAQIVLHARHQFVEGDVLHWWHPPLAKGIRTRFADDLLWLPFLASHYVATTGDRGVLDERAGWLRAPALAAGEDEKFLVPEASGESSDVYEHCCRAIDRSLVTGEHGLPLFGTGDWNDGMNRVGREGRGESVWMGFFLFAILGEFAPLCEARGDAERSARYAAHRERLRTALERSGWDGEWYRRAYYDDGTPLGSRQGDECRIDGLAQSWAVLSGAAPTERAAAAMAAAERELVDERAGLIRLLTPAFRDTPHDPGYIKGYVAGVRENGGQYTHAALWFVRALAELGRRDRAASLLAMLSPVRHTRTPEGVARYRTEPYVIVADVYGEEPHVGRGGWTWYTGSAGWMFRVALESVLGLKLEGGDTLVLEPCVPDDWPGFRVSWRVPGGGESYDIAVTNPGACAARVVSAMIDGRPLEPGPDGLRVGLVGDGLEHRIEVELGPACPIPGPAREAIR